MKNICIDCGSDYEYDPNNPLGSSSIRCSKCRKRDSKLSKKVELLRIAGNGFGKCRKCGYNKSAHGLTLVDAVLPIGKLSTQDQLLSHAKKQFILCLNCDSELRNGEFEMQVIDAKACPVIVEFYETKVEVKRQKIQSEFSSLVEHCEVVTEETQMRNANKTLQLDQ